MTNEKHRLSLVMRMGRAALGVTQQELADELGVAKSTVARNETLEMAMRADTLVRLLRLLESKGITTNVFDEKDSLVINISKEGLDGLAPPSHDGPLLLEG